MCDSDPGRRSALWRLPAECLKEEVSSPRRGAVMEYIRTKKLPKTFRLIATSDWHVGSKLFHAEACDRLVEELKQPGVFGVFNGDCIEGKPISSKHFDPALLEDGQQSAGKQARRVRELMDPVKKKWLGWGLGNHDLYHSKDTDIIAAEITGPLGIPQGAYQWVLDLGHKRIFLYHGRRTMPRGAKDPIQREANQQAWLKNQMERLRGDCHICLMGHTHALMVVEPQHQYSLMSGNKGTRARYFVEPETEVTTVDPVTQETDSRPYVPPSARWYGITGTLMRNAIEGEISYAEVAGYPPQPIGWLEIDFVKGEIDKIRPVIV